MIDSQSPATNLLPLASFQETALPEDIDIQCIALADIIIDSFIARKKLLAEKVEQEGKMKDS